MAYVTQEGFVDTMATLTGLTHDIFVGKVKNNVKRASPVSDLFKDAQQGDYRLEGQNMVFSVDLRYVTGAMATDGNVPNHVPMDAQQGKITPIRRYRRIALDNLVEKRASGPGAFDDIADRLFKQLWDSWASMEIRHCIGASSGLLGVVESRTSSTVFVIADAYGNTGTDPLTNISEGSILAWWDLTATAGIDGAGKVSSLNYSTRAVTMDSATTWEPGDQIAAGDLIYFATSNTIGDDHFISERNLAPNGLGTIVDPAAAASTVFNIAEGTYQRWKPFRQTSGTWDHLELAQHWLKLGSKRGFDVTPQTDVVVAHGSAVAQMAVTLMGLQQQAYTGGDLKGGYQQVTVSGIGFVKDPHFYHNVAMTLCTDELYRVSLSEADFFGEDGSMWSRLQNFDGKEAYVGEYMNYFSPHRGAHGAITSIVTPDVTDSEFSNTPNY